MAETILALRGGVSKFNYPITVSYEPETSVKDRSGQKVVDPRKQCSDPLATACCPVALFAKHMNMEEVRLESGVPLYSPHTLANDTGDSCPDCGRGFALVVYRIWISEVRKRIIRETYICC